MKDIGRICFIKELGCFGTVLKQSPDGHVEEVVLNWNRKKVGKMTTKADVTIPDVILVIELSVIVIKGIWDLWPVIQQIIKLIKRK